MKHSQSIYLIPLFVISFILTAHGQQLPVPNENQLLIGPEILTCAHRPTIQAKLNREQVLQLNSFFSPDYFNKIKMNIQKDTDYDSLEGLSVNSRIEIIIIRNATDFYIRNVAGKKTMDGVGDNIAAFLGDKSKWDYFGAATTMQNFFTWLQKYNVLHSFEAKRKVMSGNPFSDAAMLTNLKTKDAWVFDAWTFGRVKVMPLGFAAQLYQQMTPLNQKARGP